MEKRLNEKTALITGASRGIGAAVAIKYASEGAHVIVAGRTASELEQTDDMIQKAGGSCTIVPIDITDYEKIDQLGGHIYERFGKLDVLVGNAAQLGQLSPIHQIDPKVWETALSVNLTANFRLLRSMDPLLRMSDAGRAIFVTSSVATSESPFWGIYAVSKAALEKMAKTYSEEVRQTNIKVNLIDPGQVNTRMLAEAMPGIDMNDVASPEDVTEKFVELAEDSLDANGQIFLAQ